MQGEEREVYAKKEVLHVLSALNDTIIMAKLTTTIGLMYSNILVNEKYMAVVVNISATNRW